MARLERLETNVAVMASDVADLKANVASLNTNVASLNTNVASLNTNVASLNTNVADLQTAAWKTAEILADHSERLSGLQRTLDERLGGVNDRLDRLIAVTIQERTAGVERLGDIERRLAKLEERVGV